MHLNISYQYYTAKRLKDIFLLFQLMIMILN